jgi:serine/threonine protein phosphatase PrpC
VSSKIQIVARQSNTEAKSENFSKISICNNPAKPVWSLPEGSFVPSANGVVLVMTDGFGAIDANEAVAELVLQAIKYSVHEREDEWQRYDEKELLRSALQYAHEQLVEFKNSNSGLEKVFATAMVGLIKNDVLHLAWVGEGGLFRFSDKKFKVGEGYYKEHHLLNLCLTSEESESQLEPYKISLDESFGGSADYGDCIGKQTTLPLIKSRSVDLYQEEILVAMTQRLLAKNEETLLSTLMKSFGSSNELASRLFHPLSAEDLDHGRIEAAMVVKVVQGRQLPLGAVKVGTPDKEEEEDYGEEDLSGDYLQERNRKSIFKPLMVLAAVMALMFTVFQLLWWMKGDQEPLDGYAVMDYDQEAIVLLGADESNFERESPSDEEWEEEEEEPELVSTPVETKPEIARAEPAKAQRTGEESKPEVVKVETPNTQTIALSPTLITVKQELLTMGQKVDLLLDWDKNELVLAKRNLQSQIQRTLKSIERGGLKEDATALEQLESMEREFRALEQKVILQADEMN